MGKQASDQPQVIAGQVRVECRVAVWMQCPQCHHEHGHILTARDHPELQGPRYWRLECHGVKYLLRLSSDVIAAAVERAVEIGAEHNFSQRWISDANYECAHKGTE